MKYIPFLALIIFASACSQIRGSGHIITETRSVNSFTAVKVSSSINVDVQQGSTASVIVEGDDNVVRFVKTTVENGKLRIGFESGHNFSNATINVHVTSPALNGFEASSSADITSNGQITSANKIEVDASSSASINLKLDAPLVDVSASSSSDVTIEGRSKEVISKANSSADIDLYGLLTETASAVASSSATIKVFASVKLNATASSSGDIVYTGGVKDVNKSVSSSGSVEPR
jgi:Putative auto-transporter adhesin, head GIN domain